jgi:hypothetical protein
MDISKGRQGANEHRLYRFRFGQCCPADQGVDVKRQESRRWAVRCRQLVKIERSEPATGRRKSAKTGSYYRGEITLRVAEFARTHDGDAGLNFRKFSRG